METIYEVTVDNGVENVVSTIFSRHELCKKIADSILLGVEDSQKIEGEGLPYGINVKLNGPIYLPERLLQTPELNPLFTT